MPPGCTCFDYVRCGQAVHVFLLLPGSVVYCFMRYVFSSCARAQLLNWLVGVSTDGLHACVWGGGGCSSSFRVMGGRGWGRSAVGCSAGWRV